MDQHKGMSPIVNEEGCSACGVCVEICPRSAITIEEGVSRINRDLCVGLRRVHDGVHNLLYRIRLEK